MNDSVKYILFDNFGDTILCEDYPTTYKRICTGNYIYNVRSRNWTKADKSTKLFGPPIIKHILEAKVPKKYLIAVMLLK